MRQLSIFGVVLIALFSVLSSYAQASTNSVEVGLHAAWPETSCAAEALTWMVHVST